MPAIRISCPHCAFSRDLPAEKLPAGPVQVTCPRCKEAFTFKKPSLPDVQAEPSADNPELPGEISPEDHAMPVPDRPVGAIPRTIAPVATPRVSGIGALLARAGRSLLRRWQLLGFAGRLLVPIVAVLILGAPFAGGLLKVLNQGSAPITGGHQIITIPPPTGDFPARMFKGGDSGGASSPAGPVQPPATEPGTASDQLRASDLSVFIYAVNAPGSIRVNGQELSVIEAEADMQYNINKFGEHFQVGGNTIEFDVTPRTGDGRNLSPEIHMKVSRGGKVLGEWHLSDKTGWSRSVTVDVPEGKSP